MRFHLCMLALVLCGCARTDNIVVIYAAQDQVYAEPILREFTRQTGIEVRPLFDSEAVKTVGLANRLLQERSHPQCDVFWGNEELRTRQLAAQNTFRETNGWTGFGYRSRRIVVNTNLVSLATAPRSLLDLTNGAWRGKVAVGYPLFGTTSAHFLALRQAWGESNWLGWCRALQSNQIFLVDGNSVVLRLVGRGEAPIGLTDSDDVAAGQAQGWPVAAMPLTSEALLIPNTVAVTRNAPHPAAAQKLLDYLQSPEVRNKLVAANALESGANPDGSVPHLEVNWTEVLRDLGSATTNLSRIFLR